MYVVCMYVCISDIYLSPIAPLPPPSDVEDEECRLHIHTGIFAVILIIIITIAVCMYV